MDFDEIYNLHCVVLLSSGRKITLESLSQTRTYAGLLEGAPNKRSNDFDIECAVRSARDDPNTVGDPLLIQPERRDYAVEPGDMQHIIDRQADYPPQMRHPPEWLPPILCVGVFNSIKPARDLSQDASSLTIIWYQSDFGIDKTAIQPVKQVDWDAHASDWSY